MPIKQAGPIKRAGRIFCENFENKQALLSEQVGFFSNSRNEQGQLTKQGQRIFPKLHFLNKKWVCKYRKVLIVVGWVNLLFKYEQDILNLGKYYVFEQDLLSKQAGIFGKFQ